VTSGGFAAASALCFGMSYVVASRALRHASVVGGVLVSMVCTWLVTTVAVLVRLPGAVAVVPVLFFLAAGIISPGLSRVLDMTAVQRLGAASAVPIQAGMRPLLSFLGGVLVLGEAAGPLRAAGVALISAGLVGTLRAGPSLGVAQLDVPPGAVTRPGASRTAMLLPFLTASCFVLSDLCKKVGLGTLDEPVFAAWVAVTGSLAGWVLASVAHAPVRRQIRVGSRWPLFCLSGALTGTAQLALFQALRLGDVAVVGPISSLAPVVVLLSSRLLLRGIEHVGLLRLAFLGGIVVGAVLLNAVA
jgi:drug/metabolite transporter (DMT)-like permease